MRCVWVLMLCALLSSPLRADDKTDVVKGGNSFAFDLYAKLRSKDGNLFFSPQSISTTFAMVYGGAKGDTASEIATVLHYPLPASTLAPQMSALLKDLNNGGAAHGYQLSVANALWLQKDFTFEPAFLSETKQYYDAGANLVDFKTATEAARATINQWVEQKTAGKITNLIPAGALTEAARMVLTNAVYFKGSWAEPFKASETVDADFTVAAGKTVKAPLMHKMADFNYFDGGSYQALEIPYKGDDLSLVVFLPNDPQGLPAFEQQMTETGITNAIAKLRWTHHIRLALPKFKVTSFFPEMKATLSAMGMKQVFANADFSAIADPAKNHGEPLQISQVIHKAYVDMNEEGTEAAAATAIGLTAGAIAIPQEKPPVFYADHPFVFLIRDKHTGAILFMGRVVDPSVKTQ